MNDNKPFDWVKQVDSILLTLEEKPQFMLPAPLDWKELEKRLQTLFECPTLQLEHSVKGWMRLDQLWTGLNANILPLTIEWTPLEAVAYFVTTDQDLKQLMNHLFEGEKQAAYFYDHSLVQGFYHYFATELLYMLEQLGFASPLSPRLGEIKPEIRETLGKELWFVVDVSISLNQHSFWGKILLPKTLQQNWKNYFSNRPLPSLSEKMQEQITVDLNLEVGHTQLSLEDWKRVSEGDFIVLDHCSYDPTVQKGRVIVKLNQKPLFRGRLKQNGIKLTHYPTYEEVKEPMENQPSELEGDMQDEDLYGDEQQEFSFEEQEVLQTDEKPSISPEELPIDLTIEVGRVRMTAKELMQLSAGNFLDIHVTPEQGVDLVINGKKVGKGELIRLGETLGIRILSL